MKIDILTNDGSPLGVTSKDIWGEGKRGIGVGGAEYGLLTMCEAWTKAGHDVCLYNDPLEPNASPFEQRPINVFEPDADRDIMITFRSVNPIGFDSKGLQVWWSTDQQAIGDFRAFGKQVDRIVTISEFHAMFFEKMYDISDSIVIDLPVRIDDYVGKDIEKVPGRCIFTSVPARGLTEMRAAWPRIKALSPDASLVITSDYRLWGMPHASNDHFRVEWLDQEGIEFLGAIPRAQLIEEELKAQVLSYSCTYDELFCISVAEAQVAGAYPVTSDVGAVRTTNMGAIIPGHPGGNNDWQIDFAKVVAATLEMPNLPEMQESLRHMAVNRFNPETIVNQWDEKVFQ